MGYAGGSAASPTYKTMGDHTETVQVDYDPQRITYGRLLEIFWGAHDPAAGKSWSRQYRNAVFYHSEGQREQAIRSKAVLEKKTGKAVKTDIVPLHAFTLAEDYHQKYNLKQHPLLKEMTRIYPRQRDLVDSTAVTRLNGYLGGYGTREQLAQEIDRLGLSVKGAGILMEAVVR